MKYPILSKNSKTAIFIILVLFNPVNYLRHEYGIYRSNKDFNYDFSLKCESEQYNYTIMSSNYGQLFRLCADHGWQYNKLGKISMSLNLTSEYNSKLIHQVKFLKFRTFPEWYFENTSFRMVNTHYTYYYDDEPSTKITNMKKYELNSDWFNFSLHYESNRGYNLSSLLAFFKMSFVGSHNQQRDNGPTSIDWTVFRYEVKEKDYYNNTISSMSKNDKIIYWDDISFEIQKSISEFYQTNKQIIINLIIWLIPAILVIIVDRLPNREDIEKKMRYASIESNLKTFEVRLTNNETQIETNTKKFHDLESLNSKDENK